MGKMNELHAEGVSDLHSYAIGVEDGRKKRNEEIIRMIQVALNNPSLDLDRLTPRMAVTILVGAIQTSIEEQQDETN